MVLRFLPLQPGDGDDLVIFEEDRPHRAPCGFTVSRAQDHGEYLCLSDYFMPARGDRLRKRFEPTMWSPSSAVTMGHEVGPGVQRKFFEADRYMDYLYLHGLGVETAEEAWPDWFHQRSCRA